MVNDMAHTTTPQALKRGFTLIEMLVVMTIIALLLTLAVPRYFRSMDYGREHVQRQHIATLRDAIDKFFGDQGRYPDSLDELVTKRYLRQLPVDPIASSTQWVVVEPPDPTLGKVYDVQPAPIVKAEGSSAATAAPATTTTGTAITAAEQTQ